MDMPEGLTLESVSHELTRHVDTCEAQGIANAKVLESIAHRIEAIEKLPMMAVRYLGGIVVTAALTLLTQNFLLHQSTEKAAQTAATAANTAASTTATSQAVIVRKLDTLTAN